MGQAPPDVILNKEKWRLLLFLSLTSTCFLVWRLPGPGVAELGLQSSGCQLQSPDGPRTPLPGPPLPQGRAHPERQETPGVRPHLDSAGIHDAFPVSAHLQSIPGEVALVM